MQYIDESLDMNYFNRQKNICKGKFNKVFEVIDNKTNIVYAAKTPFKEISDFTREEMINYCQDVNIISKLNHPSIINFIGFSPIDFKERQKPVVITELASNDTLLSIIELGNENPQEWNYTKKLINIYGIASAMSYLHTHGILHCDLTPKNILVDKNFYPKLYSFNFSKEISEDSINQMHPINITSKYLAPEVKENSEYSKSSDVYTFALLVYEILHGKIESTKDTLPVIEESIPECYRQLINKCLSQLPEDRPTFEEIITLLETNPDFITENVNKDEYENYIKMIKEYPITFDSTQPILHIETLLEEIEKKERLEIIEKLLAQKKPKELMQFLNDHCDEQTTSNVFDRCFADIPEIYQELCREGISMNNNVANQKHALSLIFEKDTDKALFKQMRSLLTESVKKGFVSSYFSLARLSYIFFNKENLAFNLAKTGAKLGEKYSKCLLGYFFAHGIGTKRDHKRGVAMMLESGADDYCDMFATDIGVYYIEELHSQTKLLLSSICEDEVDDQKETEKVKKQNQNNNKDHENKNESETNEKVENQNETKEVEIESNNNTNENENNNTNNEIENKEEIVNQTNNKDENNNEIDNTNDNENSNKVDQETEDNEESYEYEYDEENEAIVEYDEVIEYEEEEDLNEVSAFQWFEKAYTMNKTKATINNYGLCFLHGIGVQKDVEKAKEIFSNDPDMKNLDNFMNIGFQLEEPNPAESLRNMMEKLIRDGNCSIPIEYAINLYKMKQFNQAYNYFQLISKFNFPAAKFFVGVMKYRGEGCEQDIDDAYQILKNLSDIGFDSASKFIEENFNLSS